MFCAQSQSYSQKWEYVSENPVRARLVEKFDDWPFQGEIGCAHLSLLPEPGSPTRTRWLA